MGGSKLQIEVTGNGDNAIAMFQRIAVATEQLAAKVKNVDPPDNKPTGLDELSTKLNAVGQLPGPVGDAFRNLAGVVTGVGTAGTAAGTALDVAFSPFTVTIGIIAVAVAGLVIAIGGLIALAGKFVEEAKNWGLAVNEFRELTGATNEASSAILAMGESVGVTAEEMTQMATAQARIMGAANEQMAKIASAEEDAKQKAQAKETALFESHNANLVDIHARAADAITALDEQQAGKKTAFDREAEQRDTALKREAVQRAAQYEQAVTDLHAQTTGRLNALDESHAQAAGDLRAQAADDEASYSEARTERERAFNASRLDAAVQLTDRLDQLEQSHADKLESLQQSLSDLQESYDQKRQDAQDRLNEQLASLDESRGTQRDAIQQRIGSSRDRFEREALTAELQAFDESTAAQKAKLEQRAADEEVKAKAEEDKKIARLAATLQRENDQYTAQTARLQAEYAKREADAVAANEREATRAQAAHDKQIAQLDQRIAREDASYSKQTESIQAQEVIRLAQMAASNTRQVADAAYANGLQLENAQYTYDQQVAASKKAGDKILADTEARLVDEQAAYKKSMSDVQIALNDVLTQAESSIPPVVKAVQDLGLSWDALNKLDPAARQWALLDALGKVEDGAKKSAIEMLLYGRAGTAVNDVAKAAHETHLPQQIEKTAALGKLMSGPMVDAAVALRDKQAEMNQKWEAAQIQLGTYLIPAVMKLNDKLMDFWKTHGPEVMIFLNTLITDTLPKLLELMGKLFAYLDRIAATRGTANGWDPARDFLNGIQSGPNVFDAINRLIYGRASGGPVTAGRPVRVGEGGKTEIFVPDSNGTILPDADAVGSAAGPRTTNNWYITANYAHQPEVELVDSIRMLAKSMNR